MSRRAARRREHWAHVVGFDDARFRSDHRGRVLVVGAVYAGERLDGVPMLHDLNPVIDDAKLRRPIPRLIERLLIPQRWHAA